MEILQMHLIDRVPKAISTLLIFYFVVKSLDMILGLLKTWKNNNYKSRIMRDGIIRWIAEIIAIVLIIGIDMILGLNFYLCGLTLSLFVYKEIGSIIENLKECGVILPNQVEKTVEVLNKDKEK